MAWASQDGAALSLQDTIYPIQQHQGAWTTNPYASAMYTPVATPPPSTDVRFGNYPVEHAAHQNVLPTSLPLPISPPQGKAKAEPHQVSQLKMEDSPAATPTQSSGSSLARRASSRRERHGAELASFQKDRFPQSSRDNRYPDFLDQLLQTFHAARDIIGGPGNLDVQFSREALKDARGRVTGSTSARGWRIWLKEPLFNRFRDTKQACTPPDTTHAEFVELLLDLNDAYQAENWHLMRDYLLQARMNQTNFSAEQQQQVAAIQAMQQEQQMQQALQDSYSQAMVQPLPPRQYMLPDGSTVIAQPSQWTLPADTHASSQMHHATQMTVHGEEQQASKIASGGFGQPYSLPGRPVKRSLSTPGGPRQRGVHRNNELPSQQEILAASVHRAKSMSQGRNGVQRRTSLRNLVATAQAQSAAEQQPGSPIRIHAPHRRPSEASTSSAVSALMNHGISFSPSIQSDYSDNGTHQWTTDDSLLENLTGMHVGDEKAMLTQAPSHEIRDIDNVLFSDAQFVSQGYAHMMSVPHSQQQDAVFQYTTLDPVPDASPYVSTDDLFSSQMDSLDTTIETTMDSHGDTLVDSMVTDERLAQLPECAQGNGDNVDDFGHLKRSDSVDSFFGTVMDTKLDDTLDDYDIMMDDQTYADVLNGEEKGTLDEHMQSTAQVPPHIAHNPFQPATMLHHQESIYQQMPLGQQQFPVRTTSRISYNPHSQPFASQQFAYIPMQPQGYAPAMYHNRVAPTSVPLHGVHLGQTCMTTGGPSMPMDSHQYARNSKRSSKTFSKVFGKLNFIKSG
ncbi:hypothetical protein HDU85_004628 [Gaertneriomyces sp. JEL0708]|nr:hypothetical protein HDU85_004628 [Gaertneriomyces sp. JEL0708]